MIVKKPINFNKKNYLNWLEQHKNKDLPKGVRTYIGWYNKEREEAGLQLTLNEVN